MPLLSGVAYYMYYFPYLSFLLGVTLFTCLQLAVVVLLMVVKYIFFVLFQDVSSVGDDDVGSPTGARQRPEGGGYAPYRGATRAVPGGGVARTSADFPLAPAGARGPAAVAPGSYSYRGTSRTQDPVPSSGSRGSMLSRMTRTAPAPAPAPAPPAAPSAPSTSTDESSRAGGAGAQHDDDEEARLLRAERLRREEESRRRRVRRRQAMLTANLTQQQ
jgi:hypothetical protein